MSTNNKKPYQRKTTPANTIGMESIKKTTKSTYTCTCCGKEYTKQLGNFPTSESVLFESNNGYLPYCKSCVDAYFKQLVKYYNDEDKALEHCCRVFDWFYDKDAATATYTSSRALSHVLSYPKQMNLVKHKGTTYLDTVKRGEGNRIQSMDDNRVVEAEGDDEVIESFEKGQVPEGAIKTFGVGYTPEEYIYLMDEFQSWITRHDCKTKTQEELFKNICRAQVTVQRAQRGGNIKEIADATKMFQDLLQSAGLKPTQNSDNTMIEQNTFGTLIKKWENERPIAQPDKEWEDVDNIKKYIDTFLYGHLCETVHLDTDTAAEYRREMAKYTVKPPQYDGDGELSDTSILDKYSNKGKDDASN